MLMMSTDDSDEGDGVHGGVEGDGVRRGGGAESAGGG